MRSLFAFLAALLLALSTPGLLPAQEASPVAEDMSGGVSLTILGESLVEQLPPGPLEVSFARIGWVRRRLLLQVTTLRVQVAHGCGVWALVPVACVRAQPGVRFV